MSEHEHGAEPSEEQIRAFEEQLKRIRVEDVIVQTLVTLVNLGARRMGLTGEPESKDMDQAKLAIEGARALIPLVPGDELGPIRDALSQLQMAFARESQGVPEPPPDAPEPPSDEEERAKARAKLWTPPGT